MMNQHLRREHSGPKTDLNPTFILPGFTLSGMLSSLSKLPPRSVVILHPAAHNPTGADPTKEEWAAIADAMQKGELFPFFDCAYQESRRCLLPDDIKFGLMDAFG